MSQAAPDMRALAEAFEVFTKSTQTMEESFRRLEIRVEELDRELEAKNRELALTSDYLTYILESMSDGVITVDTEGIVTRLNAAAGAILGLSAEETVGRAFTDLFGREFAVGRGRRLTEFLTRDGKKVPVSEKDSPLSDRDGVRIGTVKVFQDLTEVEALREQVRRMDRLAAIGEMAATVAHEIRNPLGGLRGFASLLARDVDPGDPKARLVEKIIQGAKDLDAVVNQLLEYTRPLQLRMRSVSCATFIDAAIGYVNLDGKPIAVSNEVSRELKVVADPDMMRQVFLNIILNAVQSIETEGRVTVTAEVEPERVCIAVTDTGCGMTAEQLKKVFSPFFTTKVQGTGLGLALASKIVEGHGGTLDAQSQQGIGSTFRVRIPRAE